MFIHYALTFQKLSTLHEKYMLEYTYTHIFISTRRATTTLLTLLSSNVNFCVIKVSQFVLSKRLKYEDQISKCRNSTNYQKIQFVSQNFKLFNSSTIQTRKLNQILKLISFYFYSIYSTS